MVDIYKLVFSLKQMKNDFDRKKTKTEQTYMNI